jgi:hypothetical protein
MKSKLLESNIPTCLVQSREVREAKLWCKRDGVFREKEESAPRPARARQRARSGR